MMGELTNEELKAAFRSVMMTLSKEVHTELSTISVALINLNLKLQFCDEAC